MKILGLDPGTATTGYGVIETDGPGKYRLLDFGLVSTSKELPHGERLDLIFSGISSVIEKHSPEVVAIERLFFATNALTAISVGQAIGVIKLAIHRHRLPVFDYTPMQVKLYVGGSGKADKTLMKQTVKRMLKIRGSVLNEIKDGVNGPRKKNKTHFDDAADALALAICHAKKTC
jgi:crossover junction endodeoxyribonuclease RuvC